MRLLLFSDANLLPTVSLFLCSLLMAHFLIFSVFFPPVYRSGFVTVHLGLYSQECFGVIIFLVYLLGDPSEGNGP